MKLVCIADTHGNHEKVDLPNGDILIHAGDFTEFGSGYEDFLVWFENRNFDYKLLIMGNHEKALGQQKHMKQSELTQRNGVTYIGLESVEIDGVKFGSADQDDLDVLVTHAPPKGILDKNEDHRPIGSESVKVVVYRTEPDVHIFGHIHSNYGRRTRRDTTFVNCALAGPDYEPVNDPQVITV